MIDANGLLFAFYEKQLFALSNRSGRQGFESQLVKRARRGRKLTFPAVDQDKIRERLGLTQQTRIAPPDDFVHRLEIVRPTFDRTHFEFAVVGLLHRAVLADD